MPERTASQPVPPPPTAGWMLLRFYYEQATIASPGAPETARSLSAQEIVGVAGLGGTPVGARPAAGLLPQGQVADHHRAIGRLAHVVDGEGGDGAGGERLHLHTGA